ncbi:ASCH domain-containing protein [Williamsia deligens]|uniref:ASCH domain-containing protein n=1 Tax=Williamsia deligens TaxID=321325 RepID=A0ABW3G9X6_9NOCA|nr:hypothetical protein [Williamsia deligens]MCP2193533.1 hypothetical protein [Williamsia deligens]
MAEQIVVFHTRHRDAVLDGVKTTTVRWNEHIVVGPALFVVDGSHPLSAVRGEVLSVTRRRSDTITAADVGAPQGTDTRAFVSQLRENHYPDMPDVADLDVVEFRLEFGGSVGRPGHRTGEAD